MKIKINSRNTEKIVEVTQKKNLLEILREEDFDVPALCGGNGTCGKCKVKVLSKIPTITEIEKKHLSEKEINSGIRLACLHEPADNMVLEIEVKKNYNVVSDFDIKKLNNNKVISNKKYGIAVDIGTTTVAIAFLNLDIGKIIYNKTFLNPQQQYGADVISRIDYVNNNKNNI